MADLTAIVPYHDPGDAITFIDQSSFLVENPTLGLPEYPDCEPHTGFDDIVDANDPFVDPVVWDLGYGNDENLVSNYLAKPSEFQGEGSSHENGNNVDSNVQNSDSVYPMQLSDSLVFASPDNCICCQILREITHVNGISMKRLEIHGRVGMVIHAILEKYDCDPSFQNHEFKVFDFCTKSIHSVKEFLVQYYEDCKKEGYVTLQDPLSTFYEALCVGVNETEKFDDFIPLSPDDPDTSNYQMNHQEMSMQHEDERNIEQSTKIPLAAQRVRTGNMKLKDVIGYFDHPIEDAARKLNVCPTVMKKICRRDGLPRWPYRKVKSIKKKILEKNEILNSARGDEEREHAEADIHKFQEELAKIYGIHSS
ncbi:unnamed protein product [Fraxinus pennsylvanica]|uniref:RWP-RK domain-containing protein n=1 Tax=Fraxinus pennsylvanica TaxID=56036 RepID=A0AAD1ZMG5_9LAMI|nr:unnamed protein product [Fraxinus pennsylvanica]